MLVLFYGGAITRFHFGETLVRFHPECQDGTYEKQADAAEKRQLPISCRARLVLQ